ncbi:MAG: IS66 family insertion sequence element accessory protein TnpA, partial [Acidobacteriota bacterium]
MSLRKPRRTAAQIQALLADYHSSGLTRAAFCTARRLPLSTLDAYRRRAT